MTQNHNKKLSKEEISLLMDLMTSMKSDLEKISTKKPDSPINVFKLSHINNSLLSANSVLEKMPLQNFQQFDSDTLPTYSDVVFVLSQYIVALRTYAVDDLNSLF